MKESPNTLMKYFYFNLIIQHSINFPLLAPHDHEQISTSTPMVFGLCISTLNWLILDFF